VLVAEVIKPKTGPVETIGAAEPLRSAIERFLAVRVRCLVVCDGPSAVGVLTMRDILRVLHADEKAWSAPVSRAMATNVLTVTPETPLAEVENLIASRDLNHLPVIDQGKLVGIVTLADVLRTHLDDESQMTADLKRYIHGPHVF
jgi:CBS domain-containing protein